MNDRAGSSGRLQAELLLLPIGLAAAWVIAGAVRPGVVAAAGLGAVLLILSVLSMRLAIHLTIFAMLLSPEIWVAGLGTGGSASRGLTVRFEDALIPILAFGWLLRLALVKEGGLFRGSSIHGPFFGFIGWVALCTLIAVWGRLAAGDSRVATPLLYVLKYAEFLVLFILVVNYVTAEAEIRALLRSLFLTALLVSLYAVLLNPTGRASAPFEGPEGEPNTLGGFLVFILGLVAGLFVHRVRFGGRWGLPALGAVLLVTLAQTLSRASFLGFGVMGLAVAWRLRRKPAVVAAMLAAAIVVGFLMTPDSVRERIDYTFAKQTYKDQIKIAGVGFDESTNARLMTWRDILSDISSRPVFGFGAGSGFVDAQYPRVLREAGLPGLLLFLFLIYRTWGLTRPRPGADSDLAAGLREGFRFGLIGLLVHAVGSNTWYIVRIMEPFWLVAGFLAVLEKAKPSGPDVPEPVPAMGETDQEGM